MRTRLNRSLSSIKSLAPCFMSLRVRHTDAYDFTCRHCGEILQPEREVFALLDSVVKAFGLAADKTDLGKPEPVKDLLAEAEEARAALRRTP
jgi:hypothetical protein